MTATSAAESRIYFPLASNAGWYRNEGLLDELERGLKMASVLFDRVVLDDGIYEFVATENGCMELPSPRLSRDERKRLRLGRSGEAFTLGVSTSAGGPFSAVLRGPTAARLRVDFFPVLARGGVESAPWFDWSQDGLLPEARQSLKSSIDAALRDEAIRSALPVESHWERDAIIKHWFTDALLASALECSISIDQRAANFVAASNALLQTRMRSEPGTLVVNGAFGLSLPDFGAMHWDEVVAIRESAAGASLREMLNRVRNRAAELLPNMAESDLREFVARELHVELYRELTRFAKSPTGTLVSFALNFVPGAGLVGTLTDLIAHLQHARSWVAFLKDSSPLTPDA